MSQPPLLRTCDICKGQLGAGAIVLKRVAHCSKCRLDKPNQWGEYPEYGAIAQYWDEPVDRPLQ